MAISNSHGRHHHTRVIRHHKRLDQATPRLARYRYQKTERKQPRIFIPEYHCPSETWKMVSDIKMPLQDSVKQSTTGSEKPEYQMKKKLQEHGTHQKKQLENQLFTIQNPEKSHSTAKNQETQTLQYLHSALPTGPTGIACPPPNDSSCPPSKSLHNPGTPDKLAPDPS